MSQFTNSGLFFIASAVIIIISVSIFNIITKCKIWNEINNGNFAVAMSTGGVIIGVANIMRAAISANDTLLQMIIWGGVGTIVLLAVFLLFELFTPKLNVAEEIGKGNKAVGFISLSYSIAFSMIISASIS